MFSLLQQYENSGRSGQLLHPSKREFYDAFGTSREHEIIEFILEHGTLHGNSRTNSPKKISKSKRRVMKEKTNAAVNTANIGGKRLA